MSVTPDGITLNPVIGMVALRGSVTALLLILLYQLPLADRDRIPITAEYVIYIVFITIIIVPFSAADVTSPAGSTFLLVVSIAVGVWLYLRTPRTWSVGPSVEEAEYPVWESADPEEVVKGRVAWDPKLSTAVARPGFFIHRTLFRGLTNFVPLWLILIGMAGATIVVILEFLDGTNAFLAIALVAVWHLPVLQMSLERMTPFDPLPLSRRMLWGHAFGPAVVAILIGVLVALLVYRINPSNWSTIQATKNSVDVPWEYLEIAIDGRPPTVTAPWGESVTPTAEVLWRGQRPALYDPYEITAESSPRFVEYQIRRAVTAVYGGPAGLDHTESNQRTITDAESGDDFGPLILDLTRGRRADGRSRSAAVALMLSSLVILILMVPTLFQYGSSVHRKIFKWASWGGLIFLGVLAVAIAAARLAGFTEIWYVGAVVSIGIRRLAGLIPVSTGVLWLVFVTFWIGTYLLIGKIFSRIELPGRSIVNRFAEEY
jgi:hypothetical protein